MKKVTRKSVAWYNRPSILGSVVLLLCAAIVLLALSLATSGNDDPSHSAVPTGSYLYQPAFASESVLETFNVQPGGTPIKSQAYPGIDLGTAMIVSGNAVIFSDGHALVQGQEIIIDHYLYGRVSIVDAGYQQVGLQWYNPPIAGQQQ